MAHLARVKGADSQVHVAASRLNVGQYRDAIVPVIEVVSQRGKEPKARVADYRQHTVVGQGVCWGFELEQLHATFHCTYAQEHQYSRQFLDSRVYYAPSEVLVRRRKRKGP